MTLPARTAAYETLMLWEKERQFSNIAIHNGIQKYAEHDPVQGTEGEQNQQKQASQPFKARERNKKSEYEQSPTRIQRRGHDPERELYTRLVYGVIERKLTLDYLIRQYTGKSVNRLDRSVAVILRLSLYQIYYCDKIPDSAAVSEGVKLASRYASRAKGFVNAVLRRACEAPPATLPKTDLLPEPAHPSSAGREQMPAARNMPGKANTAGTITAAAQTREAVPTAEKSHLLSKALKENTKKRRPPLPAGNDLFSLSVRYSVSEEICSLLQKQYPEEWEAILSSFNHLPAHWISVNSSRNTVAEFRKKYMPDAAELSPLPFALRVNGPFSPEEFLRTGEAFVQDAASQLAVLLLEPSPDMTVVDVCACPGGKSFGTANCMQAIALQKNLPVTGSILSCDLHANKLSLVRNGAERLGFDFLRTLCHDGRKPLPELENRADRVICDVPCSGLGVIAKKPEIRYKSLEEIGALPNLQYEILNNAASYLAPDGILLYSTCTVNKEENEGVIKRFLDGNPAFTLVPLPFVPDWPNLRPAFGMLTLLPSDLSDGFFIARIARK